MRRLIQDSLRYWVTEMHVDGFRFDLASILSRDEAGRPLPNPPVLWDIESDPLLAGTKLIAEAWDAAGLYQVGSFVGDTWQEWNGRFRDDVRRFVKGDNGSVSRLATRLLGSPDIYGHEEREAEQSINFVTCHDGFTLNDLVSYNHKHNEANGEDNRDGANDNLSWNCGVEGPTDDPAIEALRNRQVKNFLALTLLAAGTPMLLMGDEVRRTQRGNNNAYCQDNEISWFDWSLLERHADIHRFVKALDAFRQRRDVVAEERRADASTSCCDRAQIEWHGVALDQPGLERPLALAGLHAAEPARALSASRHAQRLLGAADVRAAGRPPPSDRGWRRCIDTALPSPDDIQLAGTRRRRACGDVLRRAAALRGARSALARACATARRTRRSDSYDDPSARRQARSAGRLLVDVDRLSTRVLRRARPTSTDPRAAGQLRHQRPSRLVAPRRVQRGARRWPSPRRSATTAARQRHQRPALSSARTRTRCRSRRSRRRSRCWPPTASTS